MRDAAYAKGWEVVSEHNGGAVRHGFLSKEALRHATEPTMRDLVDVGIEHERARIVAWLRSPEAHNIVAEALRISNPQFPLVGPNVLADELEAQE